MSNIYEYIGEKIKEARLDYRRIVGDNKRKLMTQTELANYCGVTFQQIQKYEKGTNKVPIDKLIMIAERTRRDILWFFPHDKRPIGTPLGTYKNIDEGYHIDVDKESQ